MLKSDYKVDPHVEAELRLSDALTHFSNTTNKLFDFYLEKAQISTSVEGNLKVNYDAFDAEGSQTGIAVELVNGDIQVSRKVKKLIAGYDRIGNIVQASQTELKSIYISALGLLVTDIVNAGEYLGGGINSILWDPSDNARLYCAKMEDNGGEFDMEFLRKR